LESSSSLSDNGIAAGSDIVVVVRKNERINKGEHMENYSDRLQTFDSGWPWDEKSHPICTPENLARCGFYHVESFTKNKDRVICYACGVDLCNWLPCL
jgi:hypothetical protein